ncbi:lasso peptide biosynthesis B2 protein [Georgenia wutianyii]|uniref:Lasso peptide biosynthesis B2 protein n=1 Tax=Georgenia wutianyii TaxID=2585135 RepID=A0ABX5VQT2_9MICO|nr:lasso peptide biosynthesis B2 protein [Georgenia wutianyii]
MGAAGAGVRPRLGRQRPRPGVGRPGGAARGVARGGPPPGGRLPPPRRLGARPRRPGVAGGLVVRPLGTVRTLLRRPPRAWFRAAQAAALAGVVEVGLRTVRLPRLTRLLGVRLVLDGAVGRVGDPGLVRLSSSEAERLDVTWRLLRHRPFNGTCLRRALLGAHALRHRDHAVRIGVQKVAGEVKAHAWLEVDGIVMDPDGIESFRSLTAGAPA